LLDELGIIVPGVARNTVANLVSLKLALAGDILCSSWNGKLQNQSDKKQSSIASFAFCNQVPLVASNLSFVYLCYIKQTVPKIGHRDLKLQLFFNFSTTNSLA